MQITVRLAIDVAEPAPRTPTVLLMSEDREWREAAGRALEREGFRVLPARHAGQALVESMRHPGAVDLLLTDGEQGLRRSDFPAIFRDHPQAALLHLHTRPRSRDELLAAVTAAIQ